MKREERIITRRHKTMVRLNDTARALDKAMRRVGVEVKDRESFLNWTVESLWNTYKAERMNKRIDIENEVRRLGLRLPNGTVHKEYTALLELPIENITGVELAGASELGLTFSADADGKYLLKGVPVKSGDYTLKLKYSTLDGEPLSELSIPVAFNPNPRSLWKNIPTDKNIPYYKPDSVCEYIKVEAGADGLIKKDIVAASQRGRSHAQEGKARDDHYSLYHCEESDWYIMAVADGAGSAKYSRKGSEVACEAIVEHCKQHLLNNPGFESAIHEYERDRGNKEKRTNVTRYVIDIIYNGALKAHEAVKQVAKANEESRLKDFATTLMFAVCKKYDFGWFIASFWVGDGAMCLIDVEKRDMKLLGTPDEGEFSGQTRFLTMPDIFRDPEVVSKRLRMTIVPDFTALILMSDGVSDPMFETDKNLNDYTKWEEFYNKLQTGFPEDEIGGVDLADDNESSKEQLLKWLDFWSPGNHDDRTIAILY